MFVLGVLLLTVLDTAGPTRLQSADGIPSVRFEILEEFERVAVLDRQTELIWERHPGETSMSWANAPMHCALKSVGGRKGWRLPSFLELMTLVQPSLDLDSSSISLPHGHPFRGVQAASYWTSTPLDSDARQAYSVDFIAGDVSIRYKNQIHPTWCVRTGATHSPRRDHVNFSPEAI
jgi:hypothetical protein